MNFWQPSSVQATATEIKGHVDVLRNFYDGAINSNPDDFESVVDVASDISESFIELHGSLGKMKRDYAELQLRYGQACLSIETDAILKAQCAGTVFFPINFDFIYRFNFEELF
jgi:hypothetical protein